MGTSAALGQSLGSRGVTYKRVAMPGSAASVQSPAVNFIRLAEQGNSVKWGVGTEPGSTEVG